jgi:hypothetical protein
MPQVSEIFASSMMFLKNKQKCLFVCENFFIPSQTFAGKVGASPSGAPFSITLNYKTKPKMLAKDKRHSLLG